jgi:phage tail protein X
MAEEQFIVHVTAAGQRWDLLAWQYYGDATEYSPIIMANPAVAIAPVFAAGTIITIPILAKSAVANSDLPPWRRTNPAQP